MMSTLRNPILFAVALIIACFAELVVIDEEVLLMLCFAAFFFNAFVNFGQQAQDSLEARAKAIKAQYLSNLDSKSTLILESIEQVEAAKKKATLWYIAEGALVKLLKSTAYHGILQLFQKSYTDSAQVLYQRYLSRKNLKESAILRALPFSVMK